MTEKQMLNFISALYTNYFKQQILSEVSVPLLTLLHINSSLRYQFKVPNSA